LPNAFSSPKKYSIQGAIWVFVMHRVAAKKVFEICRQQNNFSPNNIVNILNKAKSQYLSEHFWAVGGPAKAYSSASGHKELALQIMRIL
jgi:hypothetical protein